MPIPSMCLPTFVSGPLDKLKTIDPYEVVNGLPESEITSVLDRLDASFLDKIKPQLNQQSANAALRMGTDMLSGYNKGNMLNRAQSMIPGSAGRYISQAQGMMRGGLGSMGGLDVNSIMNYGRDLAPGLTGAFSEMQADTRNSILATIKEYEISPTITRSLTNVFGTTSMNQLLSQNGVTNFVNTFTRTFTGYGGMTLNNPRFVSLMLGGVIHQGNKLGMDGFLGDILQVIDNPMTVDLISGLVVKSVITNGSLKDYNALARYSTPGYIRSVRPTSIQELIRSYRAPRFNNVRDFPQELTLLEDTLTLIDPNWRYRLVTPEDDMINLYQLMGGSRDFNELMQYAAISHPDTENDWHWHLAHLQNFRTYTVQQEIRQAFPYVVFKNRTY